MKRIIEYNTQYAGQNGFVLGLNMFADLTLDEVRQKYTGFRPSKSKSKTKLIKSEREFPLLSLSASQGDELNAVLKIVDHVGKSMIFQSF